VISNPPLTQLGVRKTPSEVAIATRCFYVTGSGSSWCSRNTYFWNMGRTSRTGSFWRGQLLFQCRPLLEKAQPARKDIVLSRRLRFEPFQLPSPAWFLLRFPHRWSEIYSEHVTQKDLVNCSWRSYAPTSWRIPVDRLYYTENKQNKVPKVLLTFEQKLPRSLTARTKETAGAT
jgi:hypothetical protein